jgi:hypothetical protein
VPNRPTRPGKHAARHKGPTAFERASHRLSAGGSSRGLRRTGGTVVALGAVVLAGAAGTNGATIVTAADKPTTSVKPPTDSTTQSPEVSAEARERARRALEATRSQAREERADLRRAEQRDHQAVPAVAQTGSHTAQAESLVPEDPREIAQSMLDDYGWDSTEYECLDQLWISESNWDHTAENPSSGAYGIPQSLPPEKMATAGADWATNPATQIEWGLGYIEDAYGTPCSAWEFKQANNWY